MSQMQSPWPKILSGVVICELAGALAGLASVSGIRDWYPTLVKPSWTPPAWVFGPVWLVLYAMMGAALGLIWARGLETTREQRAFKWFWAQLGLNVLWCLVFFGLHDSVWGYLVIITLWLAIASTIWLFSKISSKAAWLLVPYFLWVSFASTLNFNIMSVNVMRPGAAKMDADPKNGLPDRQAPRLK